MTLQDGGRRRRLDGRVVLVAALALQLAAIAVPPPRVAAQPLPGYRIDATLDVDAATVSARQTVSFVNSTGEALDSVVFRAAPGGLGILSLQTARVDGKPREPRLDRSILEIPLDPPLAPGRGASVEIEFTLALPRSPGRISATARAVALGNWFPLLAVHRGAWDRRQYVDVGDAFYSEVADFDVTLAVSRPVEVAGTGTPIARGPDRWRFEARGVRDFALAASTNWSAETARAEGVTVTAYSASGARARLMAARGAAFVNWYGTRYGHYPYPNLAIVEVDLPLGYGGMEYPGLVMISTQTPSFNDPEGSPLDVLLAHEIAHQWFYSWVGNDQLEAPWLDEAFATYLPTLFYADTRPDLYQGILDRSIAGDGAGAVDSHVTDFTSDGPYYAVVYRRGGRFLHELREILGAATFDELIRRHVSTFRDRLATPLAFFDEAQAMTSTNLNPLISRYFSYPAYLYPAPPQWTLETPPNPWRGSAYLFVGAEFPVTRVEFWLDSRRLAEGSENAVTVDLAGVEPGEYVLLARVWNHEGVPFERAVRVHVAP